MKVSKNKIKRLLVTGDSGKQSSMKKNIRILHGHISHNDTREVQIAWRTVQILKMPASQTNELQLLHNLPSATSNYSIPKFSEQDLLQKHKIQAKIAI